MTRIAARLSVGTALFLLLSIAIEPVSAQVPRLISYQGVLTDASRTPAPDGPEEIEIRLYSDSGSLEPIFSQPGIIDVRSGHFSFLIGPLPETVRFDREYWIAVLINEVELGPRTRLTAAPYALSSVRAEWAALADTAAIAMELSESATVVRSLNGRSGSLTVAGVNGTEVRLTGDSILIDAPGSGSGPGTSWSLEGNGNVDAESVLGTLIDEPLRLAVDLNGAILDPNSGRGVAVTILPNETSPTFLLGHRGNLIESNAVGAVLAGGGADGYPNRVGAHFATLSGGRGNAALGPFGAIGGGSGNFLDGSSAVVGGGVGNKAYGDATVIGGGSSNRADEVHGTIAGGARNLVDDDGATVGGGVDNQANSINSVVAGGAQNNATGMGASVGGGESNLVYGGWGTIGGGELNHTAAEHATIGGGRFNYAYGERSTIGGGMSDTASGDYSTVGGGLSNRADGRTSSVLGGERNRAEGVASAAVSGINNVASGDLSLALGGRSLRITGSGSLGFVGGTVAQNRPVTLSANDVALFANVDLWVGSNDGEARQLRLYSPSTTTGDFPANTQFYSSFESPGSGVTQEYILPANRPSVGDRLVVKAVSGNRVELEWDSGN